MPRKNDPTKPRLHGLDHSPAGEDPLDYLAIFKLSQGFLINGKIVPSVASNNLTVAIKGLDGNDPSATNPVYCRIGDTVRSITAALSVTKNAATNWFNSGSAELATKEVDYFVYLGYNATDGVVIGFARIPYAAQYSDFSVTTTDEKYCAISTITNAVAGNNYEVIGRFAATLSAGAAHTWTVPTFTTTNLVQRPIYETRQLVSVGTIDGVSSTYSAVVKYKLQGNSLFLEFVLYGVSNSSIFDFKAPFIVLEQLTGWTILGSLCAIINNSAWTDTPGVLGITGTTTIRIGRVISKASANAYGGFTASAAKGAFGQFFVYL